MMTMSEAPLAEAFNLSEHQWASVHDACLGAAFFYHIQTYVRACARLARVCLFIGAYVDASARVRRLVVPCVRLHSITLFPSRCLNVLIRCHNRLEQVRR